MLLDSYAWIEYFAGSELGGRVKGYMANSTSPTIVLAEVSRKYAREGFRENEIRRRLMFIASRSILKEITVDIALEAAKAYKDLAQKAKKQRLRSPSLADAIVLATARTEGVKVVTGDEHFKGLSEAEYIGD